MYMYFLEKINNIVTCEVFNRSYFMMLNYVLILIMQDN